MIKDFDTVLKDFEGNDVIENGKPALLKGLIVNAIQGAADTDKVNGEEKYKRFKLIEKISKGGEVEVTAEEIVLMKKCVGDGIYTPLSVGRVYEFLES